MRPPATEGNCHVSVDRGSSRTVASNVSRLLGAIALLAAGAIHLEQYEVAHFSVIPTIGWLFLANFIAATALSFVLVLPTPGIVRVWWPASRALAAVAGLGVAAGALAALLISEQTPLFGFMEQGYRIEIVAAIATEAVAIISLSVFLTDFWRRMRWPAARLHTAPGATLAPASPVTRERRASSDNGRHDQCGVK